MTLQTVQQSPTKQAATAVAPTRHSRYALREQAIRNLFIPGTKFNQDGRSFEVVTCAKPQVADGETKTDIYINARDDISGDLHEIKISFKLPSAEFIENKLTPERAAAIFGSDYPTDIRQAATALNLAERPHRHAGKRTYVLGYRIDLMVKPKNRAYPSKTYHPITLSTASLMRIYAGTDAVQAKQNAYINGTLTAGAGIAEYILYDNQYQTAQTVIDNLIPIRDYITDNTEVYLAFKAVNFRMDKYEAGATAWDGNRPLAYIIDWTRDGDTYNGTLNEAEVFTHRANLCGETFTALLG